MYPACSSPNPTPLQPSTGQAGRVSSSDSRDRIPSKRFDGSSGPRRLGSPRTTSFGRLRPEDICQTRTERSAATLMCRSVTVRGETPKKRLLAGRGGDASTVTGYIFHPIFVFRLCILADYLNIGKINAPNQSTLGLRPSAGWVYEQRILLLCVGHTRILVVVLVALACVPALESRRGPSISDNSGAGCSRGGASNSSTSATAAQT